MSMRTLSWCNGIGDIDAFCGAATAGPSRWRRFGHRQARNGHIWAAAVAVTVGLGWDSILVSIRRLRLRRRPICGRLRACLWPNRPPSTRPRLLPRRKMRRCRPIRCTRIRFACHRRTEPDVRLTINGTRPANRHGIDSSIRRRWNRQGLRLLFAGDMVEDGHEITRKKGIDVETGKGITVVFKSKPRRRPPRWQSRSNRRASEPGQIIRGARTSIRALCVLPDISGAFHSLA